MIPSHVKIIDESSFSHCSLLEKVYFSNDSELQTIKNGAFSYSKIESILIPKHVTKINDGAFSFCMNLKIIQIAENSELKTFSESNIDVSSSCIVMIPYGLHITFIKYE